MSNIIVDLWEGNKVDDWGQVAQQVAGCILRTQYGSNHPDSAYQKYVQGCKDHGLPFSSYAYGQFVSIDDAGVESNDFMSRIDKDTASVILDVEQVTTHDPNEFKPAIQHFIDVCRAAGHKTILYTYQSFYHEQGLDSINCDGLWIAKYSNDAPDIPCDLWQYSEHGSIAGVQGDVDLSQRGRNPLSFILGDYVQAQTITNVPDVQFGALGIVTVTTGSLNLRKGPGTNYDVIRTLAGNETYLYYGSQDGYDNLGGGWGCADYLSYKPGTAIVTADNLNIRTGASIDNIVCDTAHNGDTFPVWGVSGVWVNIGDVEGHQRWVNGKYVTIRAN